MRGIVHIGLEFGLHPSIGHLLHSIQAGTTGITSFIEPLAVTLLDITSAHSTALATTD